MSEYARSKCHQTRTRNFSILPKHGSPFTKHVSKDGMLTPRDMHESGTTKSESGIFLAGNVLRADIRMKCSPSRY